MDFVSGMAITMSTMFWGGYDRDTYADGVLSHLSWWNDNLHTDNGQNFKTTTILMLLYKG